MQRRTVAVPLEGVGLQHHLEPHVGQVGAAEEVRVPNGHLRLDVEAFDRDHADLQQDCRTADEQIAQKLQAVDSSAEVTRAAVGLVDPADALLDRPGAPGTDGATPASVHDWWTSLDASQQQALIAAHPQIIGNTDGIPTAARDEANRISLALDLDRLETREDDGGSLTFGERRHLERAQAAQTALDDVAARPSASAAVRRARAAPGPRRSRVNACRRAGG